MNRNLVLIGTVAAFGFAAVVAGAGDSARAVACDETAKAASASSCSAKKGEASTASVNAAKVHGAVVKSAMVAPGAAPIANAAAFGGAVASKGDCGWCPEWCADAATAAARGCTDYSAASMASCPQGAATTAAVKSGCARDASVHTAAMQAHPGCDKSAATAAKAAGCDKSAATAAKAAGCDKSTATAAGSHEKGAAVAAGGDACCKSGAAKTAGTGETCDESKTTTAFKAGVDELPYRENKRVVLTGAYACGHCTLHVTDDCAPMFKTTDGKVYPLIKNSHASSLRKADTGKGVEIASSVKKIDGVKFLEVKSYKAL